jgi:Anti-sigma-K factor rskA
MNHEELHDCYELYALGVAGEPERSEIREHLARGCEVCMSNLQHARRLTAMLAATPDAAAPSPHLRRRIMASVGAEQRRFGWAPFLAAATLLTLFAAFYFNSREREFANETVILRDQLRRQYIELTRLNEAFAILSSPGTVEASFGQGPKGKVYVNPSRGLLLIASNLPPAPAGKIYEAWIIPKGGKPIPAGLFQSDATGAATHVQPGPLSAEGATIAVTLEPQSGSAQPTTTPLLGATLQ